MCIVHEEISRFTFVIEGESSTSARTFSAIATYPTPTYWIGLNLPFSIGPQRTRTLIHREKAKRSRRCCCTYGIFQPKDCQRMQRKLAEVRPLFLYSYDKPQEDGRDVFGMVLRGLNQTSRELYRHSCRMRTIPTTGDERDRLNPLNVYEECLTDGSSKTQEECNMLAYG